MNPSSRRQRSRGRWVGPDRGDWGRLALVLLVVGLSVGVVISKLPEPTWSQELHLPQWIQAVDSISTVLTVLIAAILWFVTMRRRHEESLPHRLTAHFLLPSDGLDASTPVYVMSIWLLPIDGSAGIRERAQSAGKQAYDDNFLPVSPYHLELPVKVDDFWDYLKERKKWWNGRRLFSHHMIYFVLNSGLVDPKRDPKRDGEGTVYRVLWSKESVKMALDGDDYGVPSVETRISPRRPTDPVKPLDAVGLATLEAWLKANPVLPRTTVEVVSASDPMDDDETGSSEANGHPGAAIRRVQDKAKELWGRVMTFSSSLRARRG